MIIYHLTSKIDTGCTQHYQRMPGIQIYGALRKYSKKYLDVKQGMSTF